MPHRYSLAALWLALTACSVVTPFPESWPEAVAPTPDCRPPEGVFDNLGVWAIGDDMDPVLLSQIFFPLKASEPLYLDAERQAVTQVALDAPAPSQLRVRGLVGAEILFERLLEGDAVGCIDGQFAFQQSNWELEGLVGAVGRSRVTYRVSLDTEGALLLHGAGSGAGVVFMVVPMVTSDTSWRRFPRLVDGKPAEPYPPDGVRSPPTEVWQLLTPPDVAKWGSYQEAQRCLALAQSPAGPPAGQARQAHGDLVSDEFLTGTRAGALSPQGWTHDQHGWVPGSHALRVRKQHWAAPEVSDRYLDCLLARGFQQERRPVED